VYVNTHTHTHIYIYVYKYIYINAARVANECHRPCFGGAELFPGKEAALAFKDICIPIYIYVYIYVYI